MKKPLDIFILFIASAFCFSLVQSFSSDIPKYETQYFMELPAGFLNSLNKDERGNAVLWHPRLTITKVHHLQENIPNLMLTEKESSKKSNSNFVSFLQIKQTNQGTDSLTFIPGKPDLDDSALKASKMNCMCRFVKDSNPFTLLQTAATVPTGKTAPGLVQNNKASDLVSTENPVLLAETSNAKVDDIESIQKESSREKGKFTKDNGEWNDLPSSSNYNEEKNSLTDLVKKNELLKAQLENENLKEALQRERLENEREELLKQIERNQRYPNDLLRSQSLNDDYLLPLLNQNPNGRGANLNSLDYNELNDYYEFQKYQQYKSLMAVQNSNPKSSRFASYNQRYNNIPSDYDLLERDNLRKNLLRALVN